MKVATTYHSLWLSYSFPHALRSLDGRHVQESPGGAAIWNITHGDPETSHMIPEGDQPEHRPMPQSLLRALIVANLQGRVCLTTSQRETSHTRRLELSIKAVVAPDARLDSMSHRQRLFDKAI